MSNIIHREKYFERYITDRLLELGSKDDWRVNYNDQGFDPNTALYFEDFIEYVTAVSPEKVEKMKKTFGDNWENNLRLNLVKSLEVQGTVQTLRNGFQMAGFQTIECSGHYPDDPRLKRAQILYEKNILRAVHQVHYQTAGNKSLDLVFFINGIPVATAEVKTELTQTVQDAIIEYQTQRKPIEPGTNRKNYLLMYKRGAVVHFAISEDEIWMCTNLSGNKPKFLPFNKGNDGHAGNPARTSENDSYPTEYLWTKILQKDNWLRIFHNFVFEKIEKKEDATGRMREVSTQLFPRYHQWDCVVECIDDVKKLGVGQKYLIEHSAGSGKTETISWIAHELIRLMDEKGNKLFTSVIVVTDRIGLDTNIKLTIKQLKKTVGLIEMIGGDGDSKRGGAKSKQLIQALHENREIIVVTLQTFPYAMDAIAEDESLVGSNFAVLIDEAHSSQSGISSGKMKAALKLAGQTKKKRKNDFADPDEFTDEDEINAYFAMQQANHVLPENVSFFAFTATPKAETKTIFGRAGNKIDEKTGTAVPESFHLYPMRQAIEEGYILDVLKGYMPYKTAYQLKETIINDKMVDKRNAIRTIAKWQNHHPTNVMSKAEFIIEHFTKNVSQLLDGQAKAMIVTSSRAAVVRYKHAIDDYLKSNPQYDRSKVAEHLQFKVPGEPLVAFSDKISGAKCIMNEDQYLENNPFALIKEDYDYTEENMNNLGYQSVEKAFDSPKNRLMIVANKFQTGFNQPKLCAMYIDKKISNDIEIVQTYSRLNRNYAGKDQVYIIDFVNEPETVYNAFKKYDKGAKMERAQNLDIIYDIKNKLDDSDIYTKDELDDFKKVYYQSIISIQNSSNETYRQKIYNAVSLPADRWNSSLKAQQNALVTWQNVLRDAEEKNDSETIELAENKLDVINEAIANLLDFRKKLKRYCSAYNFISQIIDLGEPDLEVFNAFSKLLYHRLSGTSVDDIDIKNLVLMKYKINENDYKPSGEETKAATLKPMRSGNTVKRQEKEYLLDIIRSINAVFGEDVDEPLLTRARTINAIADYVTADDISRIQIRNSTNSKEAILAEGRLENIIKMAALSLKNNDFEKLAERIIMDPQSWKPLAEVIFDLVDQNKRIEIAELSEYLKNRRA